MIIGQCAMCGEIICTNNTVRKDFMNIALGNDSPLQGHCVRRAMRDAWVVSGLHPIVLLATEETTCHPGADECIPPVRDMVSLLKRLGSVGEDEGQVSRVRAMNLPRRQQIFSRSHASSLKLQKIIT